MHKPLSEEEIETLRRITTPTLSNAIERFDIRPKDQGFMDPSIKCVFPEMGAMVGYACTVIVSSAQPPRGGGPTRKAYWDHLSKYPSPRIIVAHDVDQPPRGAFWGEVNANIHRALGCVGVITDGTVRDLTEVRALGFHFFAPLISVSHAFAHLEDFDQPVTVGGLTVRPGDLIHADQHGALLIPHEIARQVAAAAAEVDQYEKPMISLCKSSQFSTEKLAKLFEGEII